MVAISLYRGNLHRVPDVPRRWLMPNHTLSLKDFKSLLRKREKTLFRLRSTTTTIPTTYNPNPNSCAEQPHDHEFVGDNECSRQNPLQSTPIELPQPQTQTTDDVANDNKTTIERVNEEPFQYRQTVGDAKDQSGSEGDNCGEEQRKGIGDSCSSPDTKSAAPEIVCDVKDDGDGALQIVKEEKQQLTAVGPDVEISKNVDLLSDTEKKKRDLEQNLKVLNERKHNLVQMLKQILNAEEEIKRRNSMQASVVRPPIPQQLEATTDLGSNPTQFVNRLGPEANFCGDLEGESEDISNHNTHGRQYHQMRSTSPSAASPLRKLAHSPLHQTGVPHSNRPNLGVSAHTQTTSSMFAGVASSPSRFAPTGHQGHPASLPPLSVSGTHCTASSPSPAGSGGTSVCRDARITSPSWN